MFVQLSVPFIKLGDDPVLLRICVQTQTEGSSAEREVGSDHIRRLSWLLSSRLAGHFIVEVFQEDPCSV